MAYEWLDLEDVLAQIPGSGADDPAVERARAAAADYVERMRPDLAVAGGTFTATPSIVLGAAMVAARLYARRGSPTGIASYGEFGPAAVLRLDPDAERLLGIGRYGAPVVG